jgi:peptidyl-prolyl cis-trans isomerase SurA
MKLKRFFTILLSYLILISNLYAEEKVYIELKIENEIITNIDINNEQNYLIALNNNLKNLDKKQLYSISKNSLIREKIKNIELVKFFDLEKSSNLMEGLIENLYKNLKFNDEKEFSDYLNNYNLEVDEVRKKILIEALWNQLIYDKFNKNININEDKLKIKLEEHLKKNKIEEFNLSEIIFEIKPGEKFEKKGKKILNFINDNGFKNTANSFSISDSAKFGGKIGWVNKTQISKIILDQVNKLQVGEITDPIQINNGYIIIKLNDKRLIKRNIDIDKEMKKLIIYEKDKQLNQYSLMYFNRVKKNLLINEL